MSDKQLRDTYQSLSQETPSVDLDAKILAAAQQAAKQLDAGDNVVPLATTTAVDQGPVDEEPMKQGPMDQEPMDQGPMNQEPINTAANTSAATGLGGGFKAAFALAACTVLGLSLVLTLPASQPEPDLTEAGGYPPESEVKRDQQGGDHAGSKPVQPAPANHAEADALGNTINSSTGNSSTGNSSTSTSSTSKDKSPSQSQTNTQRAVFGADAPAAASGDSSSVAATAAPAPVIVSAAPPAKPAMQPASTANQSHVSKREQSLTSGKVAGAKRAEIGAPSSRSKNKQPARTAPNEQPDSETPAAAGRHDAAKATAVMDAEASMPLGNVGRSSMVEGTGEATAATGPAAALGERKNNSAFIEADISVALDDAYLEDPFAAPKLEEPANEETDDDEAINDVFDEVIDERSEIAFADGFWGTAAQRGAPANVEASTTMGAEHGGSSAEMDADLVAEIAAPPLPVDRKLESGVEYRHEAEVKLPAQDLARRRQVEAEVRQRLQHTKQTEATVKAKAKAKSSDDNRAAKVQKKRNTQAWEKGLSEAQHQRLKKIAALRQQNEEAAVRALGDFMQQYPEFILPSWLRAIDWKLNQDQLEYISNKRKQQRPTPENQ